MLDMDESTPPEDGDGPPRAVSRLATSSGVQDRVEASVPGEQRVAAEPEQVEVERLLGLLLAVAVDDDRDRLGRLAGGEGQRASLGDVTVVAGLSPCSHEKEQIVRRSASNPRRFCVDHSHQANESCFFVRSGRYASHEKSLISTPSSVSRTPADVSGTTPSCSCS